MEPCAITPIARIRTDFSGKFGIPRQSGLVPELTARIVFEPEYRDPGALAGIEEYSHLWLIWQFSTVAAEFAAGRRWRPTVRPPRLGGNVRRGVFATRKPLPPQRAGAFLRGTGRGGGLRPAGARRGPSGRHAHL